MINTLGRRVGIILVLGMVIRITLLSTTYATWFTRRVEIVSPLTSAVRLTECATLAANGMSPYAGDTCHHVPLVIWLYSRIETLHPLLITFWSLALDAIVAIMLSMSGGLYARKLLEDQVKSKSLFAKGVEKILLNETCVQSIAWLVSAMYYLNPYTIATSLSLSTTVLQNEAAAIALFCMLLGWPSVSCVMVAVATYFSCYPLVLIVPVTLHACKERPGFRLWTSLRCVLIFLVSLCALFAASMHVASSWEFVDAVYGFILKVPDLTPNMGLFWYFFLEMFDHFKLFFLWVFQINAFVYLLPLSILLRNHPVLLFYALLSVNALFKSYPVVGDLSLPIAMIAFWSHVYKYMRNVLLVVMIFIFTSVLSVAMWYLWLYAGSGNANFFYAVTLAYSVAQVFLLGDVIYACLRYEFHLTNGLDPQTKDGKAGHVVMK